MVLPRPGFPVNRFFPGGNFLRLYKNKYLCGGMRVEERHLLWVWQDVDKRSFPRSTNKKAMLITGPLRFMHPTLWLVAKGELGDDQEVWLHYRMRGWNLRTCTLRIGVCQFPLGLDHWLIWSLFNPKSSIKVQKLVWEVLRFVVPHWPYVNIREYMYQEEDCIYSRRWQRTPLYTSFYCLHGGMEASNLICQSRPAILPLDNKVTSTQFRKPL